MDSSSSPPWLRELLSELGPARVSLADEDREVYARDLWPRTTLNLAAGQPLPAHPRAVVWPDSAAQVAQVVRLCRRHGVPLVPYGAGSGVGGAAVGPEGSLVLDTKGMRAVQIDRASGTVTCEPGVLGWHLEQQLQRAGLTLGHFPSSIMCSTVGGWVATRGAGQMSTKYGKIEDMIRSLSLVNGEGQLVRVENGDSGGPDLLQCLVGSEGTLGILTSMNFTLRRQPAARRLRGFAFPSVEAGCHAIRHLMQRGLRPAVVRLYDELDTLIAGAGRSRSGERRAASGASPQLTRIGDLLASVIGRSSAHGAAAESGSAPFDVEELLRYLKPDADRLRGRVEQWLLKSVLSEPGALQRLVESALVRLGAECLLILGFEGDERIVQAEDSCAREEMAHCGGRDLGPEPGQRWLAHRYNVSFKMSRVFRAGAFSDTIEVATTWERLLPLYRAMRAAVAPHALIMAHFSHAYVDGCSIYFTVMARRSGSLLLPVHERAAALEADQTHYDTIWRAAMGAALAVGAAISHHHGVGRLKTPFLVDEQREGMQLLATLKQACDPAQICNPGNLIPAGFPPPAPRPVGNTPPPRLSPAGAAASFLHRARGEQTLGEIEALLRGQGGTLGGLPPWAYRRSLEDALHRPHPSEASLGAGRLRDRVAQLAASLPDGRPCIVPPSAAPRRATGPDVSQLLLGTAGTLPGLRLHEVLLRCRPTSAAGSWIGLRYSDPQQVAQALCRARALHGAAAFDEVVVVSRELLARLPGAESALAGSSYALLLCSSGPAALHGEIVAALGGGLAAVPPTGELPGALCHDLWSASSPHVSAMELPVDCAVNDSADALAALLQTTGGPRLLCGIYLHGAAFVGERLPEAPGLVLVGAASRARPATASAAARASDLPDSAYAQLWPRLVAHLGRSTENLTPQVDSSDA